MNLQAFIYSCLYNIIVLFNYGPKKKRKRNSVLFAVCLYIKPILLTTASQTKCFVAVALSTEMHSGVLDSELWKQNAKLTWAGFKKRDIVCCCDLWMCFVRIQTLPNPVFVISCVPGNREQIKPVQDTPVFIIAADIHCFPCCTFMHLNINASKRPLYMILSNVNV